MPTLWEDIKKTIKDGISVAAEKTEEYTKIGKLKVDILNINRSIDKEYKVLGEETFKHISSGKKTDIAENEKTKKIVTKIKGLQKSLKDKEKEIEVIKQEAEKKAKEKPQEKESEKKPKETNAPKKTGSEKTKASPKTSVTKSKASSS
jgi:hypothetical protein